MAVSASVVDGKIVDTTASALSLSEKEKEKAGGSALDKDAFLQLLVAEMKNQDPLEPTTNTEYISQFATFSQLEEMQNMSSSVDMSRAQSLIGKDVFLEVTDSTGNTSQITGRVDYVVMESGKVYVSIEDQLYSFDDVTTVLDDEYWTAYNMAYDWTITLAKLSNINDITLGDKSDIEALRKTYDDMTDYQKSFVASDSIKILKKYEEKIDELELKEKAEKEKAEAAKKAEGDQATNT